MVSIDFISSENYITYTHTHIYTHIHTQSPQPCLTLCDPINCSLPGSSVHDILLARILEWVDIYIHIHTHTYEDILCIKTLKNVLVCIIFKENITV